MIERQHIYKQLNKDKRWIVVSDLHSHYDRFQQLLKSIHYHQDDILIINGDFVEKGTQTKQLIHFIQELQKTNNNVYVILGNCEYALETLINDDAFCDEMFHYLRKIGKSGLIDQSIHDLNIDILNTSHAKCQRQVREYLKEELDYLKSLPTSLETDEFLFVHAGIEKRKDWKNSSLSSLIEMKTFLQRGHVLDKYVVVGHIPTSNQYMHHINNDIIIDKHQKIICLDGGTGVKTISQLNALIIHHINNQPVFETICYHDYPQYRIQYDIEQSQEMLYKVAWPYFQVELLEEGKSFSLCRQMITNDEFMIKNEFLFERGNSLFCLDDYTNYMHCVKRGQIVLLIYMFDDYSYVLVDGKPGWVPTKILEKMSL